MESFPEWVPPSVIDYYNSVPNAFKPDLNLEPEEIEFLRKVMSAVDMKKAWEAISKRSDIVDPSRFAYSIASDHCMTRSIDRFATPENISDIYDLAEQTRKLADTVARKARIITGEDWFDERRYPLRAILKVPPY